MKANDDLHRLVHSLSPSEKRYFRLAVLHKRGEKHNFLRLFDAVLAQAQYDQKALLEQFKDGKMGKRFSAEKNHLFELILRSMRNYDAARSVRIKIRGLITDGGFLYGKALYEPCVRVFKRARKLAEESEDFPALVEILIWERKLIKRSKKKDLEEILEQSIADKNHILQLLENQFAYFDLYDRLFLLTQQETQMRDQAQIEQVAALVASPLMQEFKYAQSFQARHFFYQVKAYFHQLSGESQQAYTWYGKLVQLWKKSPNRIREDIARYKVVLSNYLAFCAITDAFAKFPNLIEELRNLPSATQHESIRTKQNLILYELQFYMNMGEFEKGVAFIQECNPWVEKHVHLFSLTRTMGLYSNYATLYFFNSKFKKALQWTNHLLRHPASQKRMDIQHLCRFLQLMIHIELGNDDVLENLIRSMHRFLQGRKRLFLYEKTFLKQLKKIISRPTNERPTKFATLAKDLKAIESKDKPRYGAGTTEIDIWLKSKAEGKDLSKFAKAYLLKRPSQTLN